MFSHIIKKEGVILPNLYNYVDCAKMLLHALYGTGPIDLSTRFSMHCVSV